MNLESAGQLPTIDVELEDGEICDDDGEETSAARLGEGNGGRPPGAAVPPRGPRPPYMGPSPPGFRRMMPYDVHGPSNHRQQCGPSGPDRPRAPGPLPLPPGPGPGLAPLCGGPGPRPSFWERSHGALGRFRHRSVSNGGRGAWNRGGWTGHRPPMARYGQAENSNREPPGRKQKPLGRIPARRPPPSMAKCEGAESFEDLLCKYKQIQMELECIRKEESMALEAKVQGAEPKGQEVKVEGAVECPAEGVTLPQDSVQVAADGKKSFQAFNIKPLRVKLFTPASLDTSTEEEEKQQQEQHQEEKAAGAEAKVAQMEMEVVKPRAACDEDAKDGEKTPGRESSASSEDVFICIDELGGQLEEEDLSELQLRLLALQSASRKWQQKERQVMKRSREPRADERTRTRSRPQDLERDKARPGSRERPKASPKPGARTPPDRSRAKKSSGSAPATKQALRKLQRQREEDERHKREDEIRKIRDLSNQDEQYKRFMKLVGGKTHGGAKARDGEGRKSAGRTGTDAAGNLYQYDNYDEVAMETDSEPGSPARAPFPAEGGSPSFPVTAHYATPFAACAPPPLPPPPPPAANERAPPPKPPFADEEEEEEMLLRETCLMSMANKRVVTEEEPSWSGPRSPSAAALVAAEQPGRGNLSAVSLNTMTAPHGHKFARGGGASRAPLVLPRHKSVVVSLNGSDDSDSDLDVAAATAAQGMMYGGLEFMIKEARRTAEVNANKSKGAAETSEKENDPMRTPEALPEDKKAEYRCLREELASREKQKASGHDAHSATAAAATAASLVSEAEQKLLKQRELLARDEALLKSLLQQQLKKSESLKAAESKVARLREQMQASEKIVLANKTLLKKIQEQVRRVEHRVSIKKALAARLAQELLWTQKAAGREPKRKAGAVHKPARKLQRVDAANHIAALMAQKQRLQQLESEYALKIQKLKEAQVSRNRAAASEAPSERRPKPAALPEPKVCLPASPGPPQPSLHDLTQDILVLGSDDGPEPEADEPEAGEPKGDDRETACGPAAGSAPPRRRSFRRSSSTKPNLEQPSSAPAAKGPAPAAAAKNPADAATDACAAGLDLEALRRRHQQQLGLGELLLQELASLGELHHVEDRDAGLHQTATVPAVVTDASRAVGWPARPVPFGPYRSPLLVFKSYRFSPYYRTKEKLSLSSATYSNTIRPKRCFCRFDLTGTCNDDDCSWQHVRSCTLTGSLLFQDVLSYNLSLIGCSDSSTDSQVGAATEKYLSKLFGPHKDGMAVDQKAVFLVSKVNESRRHVPPFTTWKDKRNWRPSAAQSERREDRDGEENAGLGEQTCATSDVGSLDARVTSEDKRYFVSDTDDIGKLESSVSDNPDDTQLWIKLAFRYLHQGDTPPTECLEAALNTLSRALESNCDDPEVWTHFLTLFSRRGRRDEVEEMCQMAVEHAPHHRVWWNYLSLASTFEAKDSVCERLVGFLLGEECGGGASEERSFRLLEALLYRVHLNVFTGRTAAGLAIFQDALTRDHPHASVAGHLEVAHRALAWLSYIHLKEFGRLPSALYDPTESGPSRLVSAESFPLPWRSAADIKMPQEQLIGLFTDGIRQCCDESLAPRERTLACLPLHTNFLLLHKLSGRLEAGVLLCEALLEACPESCVLRDVLCEFHVCAGDGDGAAGSWLRALAECPDDAEVFYHCCRFLMAQDKWSAVTPLFQGFVSSLCEEPSANVAPVDLLRSILGLPTDEVRASAVVRKDLRDRLLRQRSFLHLLHCRWHWLRGSVRDTLDAFERALGSAMTCDELHRLWTDYLGFCSAHAAQRLPNLILRCLGTVPARLEVPFDPTHFWTSYRFHNKVVALYLSCVDASQHAALLERLHYMMPANLALSLRLMQRECSEGNMEHVRFQAKMLTNSAPKCLPAWNVAIAAEAELRQPAEARRTVQQALQNLPLCAQLWKHLLQWEACVGSAGATERACRVLSRSEEAGVTLAEPVASARTDAV
ncbi:zinc finger C3H1 domain-containing protein-like isoform X2 [Hippocampus zosterae]|uniref:zinc finger C3H1 domain-containing protein-like isoform X2 n=1 Tax=Hippocampus zosterae TaxID=109293 RepID=UPI00223D43E3|nr:zinc finger C3H1 domain-containing protein-like isoform X2 [Hippocampus zosterae]